MPASFFLPLAVLLPFAVGRNEGSGRSYLFKCSFHANIFPRFQKGWINDFLSGKGWNFDRWAIKSFTSDKSSGFLF